MSEKLTLDSVLRETRIYKPSPEFVRNAWVPDYEGVYQDSIRDMPKFWEGVAGELDWFICEGAPDYPQPDRWWSIVERYRINILEGRSQPANVGGYLVVKKPWPAMLASIYKDPERYKQQYWSIVPNVYTTGEAAVKDEDGYIRVMGRMDDVLNVAGHRLGTMEIESALVHHPAVAEAAVIGKPHDIKGEVPKAFVTLRPGYEKSAGLVDELKEHVAEQIGKIARPEEIEFVERLPKTRSGKIMRRLLKAKERGEALGDISTLEPGSIPEEE